MTPLATLRAVDAVTTDAALRLAVLRLIEALEEARRERDLYQLMFHASMDGLALVATAPERYEQQQRELRKEREAFMAEEFAGEGGVTAEQSDALKLLNILMEPCEGSDVHSWRKCRHCIAVHGIEMRLPLTMRLLAVAIDGLEEWLP